MGKSSYRTFFLAAIAVIVLSMQLFPNQGSAIRSAGIVLGILYLAIVILRTYPEAFKNKRKKALQEAADGQQYRQYEIELNSIRAKYGQGQSSGESGTLTPEYKDELSALHGKYQAMLERKFGSGRSSG